MTQAQLLQIRVHVDKDARWRWQHIPLSIKSGVKVDTRLDRQESAGDNSLKSSGIKTIRLLPHFCIKSKSSIFGSLGKNLDLHSLFTGCKFLELVIVVTLPIITCQCCMQIGIRLPMCVPCDVT